MQGDVEFKINKSDGDVIGFSLKGVGNTDAEAICFSFIRAQQLGKGDVFFRGKEIVFKHDGVSLDEADPNHDTFGVSEGGEFCYEIMDDNEREQLSHLLQLTGLYSNHKIFVKPEISWGKGFTVYTKKK
jgi:hypothetical protein